MIETVKNLWSDRSTQELVSLLWIKWPETDAQRLQPCLCIWAQGPVSHFWEKVEAMQESFHRLPPPTCQPAFIWGVFHLLCYYLGSTVHNPHKDEPPHLYAPAYPLSVPPGHPSVSCIISVSISEQMCWWTLPRPHICPLPQPLPPPLLSFQTHWKTSSQLSPAHPLMNLLPLLGPTFPPKQPLSGLIQVSLGSRPCCQSQQPFPRLHLLHFSWAFGTVDPSVSWDTFFPSLALVFLPPHHLDSNLPHDSIPINSFPWWPHAVSYLSMYWWKLSTCW